MSLENCLLEIQQKYICSEPLYLSNFFQPNGDKWLHNKLADLYQAAYNHNYRILVIQDCPDTYKYSGHPGMAIETLQKYIGQIDISNCFVLLLTGNQNIATELFQVKKLYSTDKSTIQYQIVNELPQAVQPSATSDTF